MILVLLAVAHGAPPVPKGAATYAAKCAACHGTQGRGDGPVAASLPRKPRDLSNPEFWATVPLSKVRSAVTDGIPGSAMRGYPMPAPQLTELVTYLRSFATEQKP
jgi:mono/diheme cytochrome c family protein